MVWTGFCFLILSSSRLAGHRDTNLGYMRILVPAQTLTVIWKQRRGCQIALTSLSLSRQGTTDTACNQMLQVGPELTALRPGWQQSVDQ